MQVHDGLRDFYLQLRTAAADLGAGRNAFACDPKAANRALRPAVAVAAPARTLAVMAWTYILRCCDGSYYVGSTTNLDLRMQQHHSGTGSVYTATRRPVELVWAHEFETIPEAFAFEKQVQNWSRAKREAPSRDA